MVGFYKLREIRNPAIHLPSSGVRAVHSIFCSMRKGFFDSARSLLRLRGVKNLLPVLFENICMCACAQCLVVRKRVESKLLDQKK
jgi:hypothetical protein